MNTADHSRAKIPALTGLRLFPALYVVYFHFFSRSIVSSDLARDFVENGRSAVQLFFILSGFILTYVYYAPQNSGVVKKGDFWFHRFARIYPLYLFAMIVYLPFIASQQATMHGSTSAVIAHLAFYGAVAGLLVQAWVPRLAGAWNARGWSLSAEAFFYALFPFVLPRLHGLSRRALWIGLGVLWIVTLIPNVVFVLLPPDLQNGGDAGFIVDCNPLPRVFSFLAGVVLGRLFVEAPAASSARADIGAIASAFALVMTLLFADYMTTKVLVYPEMLALIWFLGRSTGPFARLLGSRVFVLLGNASFAMYILHYPVGRWFVYAQSGGDAGMLTRLSPPYLTTNGSFYLFLAILTGCSVMSYLLFERPMWTLLMRLWRKRSRVRPTVDGVRVRAADGTV
jgi:peptidoglycan/LPS O-acetylase OafA/YrhL